MEKLGLSIIYILSDIKKYFVLYFETDKNIIFIVRFILYSVMMFTQIKGSFDGKKRRKLTFDILVILDICLLLYTKALLDSVLPILQV